MPKSIADIPKKRGRPATTGRGIGIMVRFQDEPLAELDAWIEKQKDPLTRPQAIRQLVAAALDGRGKRRTSG